MLAGLANGMDTMGFISTIVSKTADNKSRFVSYVQAETGKKNLNFDTESEDEKGQKQPSAIDLFEDARSARAAAVRARNVLPRARGLGPRGQRPGN